MNSKRAQGSPVIHHGAFSVSSTGLFQFQGYCKIAEAKHGVVLIIY
jgi:hypothetical protein